MLIKKHMISFLTVVFILVGCDSDNQSLDNEIGVSTVISTNEDSTSTENEGQTDDTDQGDSSTEETEVKLSKPIIVETIPSNWYIRLVAEDTARGLTSSSSQLGELEENDAVEKHTLKALSPLNGSYLDIIFVDPVGVVSGEYKSNFHVYQEGTEDQWSFTVKTDDNRSDILLTWQGLYVLTPYTDEQSRKRYKEYRSVTNPLIKHMKLVDITNGKEIALMVDGKIETYTFNMNGQNERTFKWVMQNEEVILSAHTSKVSTIGSQVLKSEVRKQSVSTKSETFDLTKPPMIK